MKRRPGRPRLAPDEPDPSVTLSVRVPATQYDAAQARATALRVPIADYVREALRTAAAAEPVRPKRPK